MTILYPLALWLFLLAPPAPTASVYDTPGEAEYDHAVIVLWMQRPPAEKSMPLDEWVTRRSRRTRVLR